MQWIPGAYSPPSKYYEAVSSIAAITTLWTTALESLGMSKLVKELKKPGSARGTSLSGLPAAGITLAICNRSPAER